jgi:hypothetical protein
MCKDVWSGAFTATKNNEVFSGYQPRQVVKWRKHQCFEDHIRPRPQGTEVAGVPIRVIYIPVRAQGLVARENFVTCKDFLV